jgi:hypothetical protein
MKYIEIDDDLVNDVKIELNGNEKNTNESWKRHIERKSIIVDLFQGISIFHIYISIFHISHILCNFIIII